MPAADGVGDPQLSWLVTRGRTTIVHAGDTLIHGWWWRVAQRAPNPIAAALVPVNGARVNFAHRQPPSPLRAVMNAQEAAAACTSMGARRMVPIHHGAYDFPDVYEPDPDPLSRLEALALDAEVLTPGVGDWVDLAA